MTTTFGLRVASTHETGYAIRAKRVIQQANPQRNVVLIIGLSSDDSQAIYKQSIIGIACPWRTAPQILSLGYDKYVGTRKTLYTSSPGDQTDGVADRSRHEHKAEIWSTSPVPARSCQLPANRLSKR